MAHVRVVPTGHPRRSEHRELRAQIPGLKRGILAS
jgi:hypothetical protein